MSTVKNTQSAEQKKNAITAIMQNAEVIADVQNDALKADKAESSLAQKSGLAYRMECHKAKLSLYEYADKPTLIGITSKNIPNSVTVICSEGKGGKVVVKVWDNADLNVGTEEEPLTTEQNTANTIITTLTGKINKLVCGYINDVLDICRNFAELKAVAVQQRDDARKAVYERMFKKAGIETK